MTDREKVIKEFELFIKEFHPACTSEGVELDMFREVFALLKEQEDIGTELTNAVELIHKKNERIKKLLKEQEPKQIVRKQGKRENSDGSIDFFGELYCPHCGKLLNRGFDLPWIEFCYKCGKPILWEGR